MRDVRWLAICIAVSGVMQAPFTNYADFGSALHQGDGRVQAWVLAWVGHALEERQPLFDANMFFPTRAALAHTDHMTALGVVGLPIWLATHNAILVFNLLKLLGPAIAAWAMARLAYAWTGDAAASRVAGLAYGFSSFTMLHNAHLNLTWSAGIPLALLAMERWWATPTWPRLAAWWVPAIFTALVSWYLALMLGIALALWMLIAIVVAELQLRATYRTRTYVARSFSSAKTRFSSANPWGSAKDRAIQLLPATLLAIAVLLPFAAPYLGRGSEPGEAAALAADWRSYLVPHDHTLAGGWLVSAGLAQPQGIWGERSLFLGWTFLGLACVGAVTSRDARAIFLVVLALVAAALSFGPSSTGLAPFDLLARLPVAGGFRASARFALLVTLACGVLGAYGLSWIRRRLPGTRRWLPAASVVLILGEAFVVRFPGGRPAREPMPEIYSVAAADGAKAAVALPMYAGEPQWFLEGDYLLYSTAGGFIPLANGIGRWVPAEYLALGEVTDRFPSPETGAALRLYGMTHVLFHGARFGADAPVLLDRVRQGHDFTIVATRGSDTLLRVRPE